MSDDKRSGRFLEAVDELQPPDKRTACLACGFNGNLIAVVNSGGKITIYYNGKRTQCVEIANEIVRQNFELSDEKIDGLPWIFVVLGKVCDKR